MSVVSFKQRVCSVLINCALDYKTVFLDYDYLIYSKDFVKEPYYTVSAKEGNYKHLTGVCSEIPPYAFFEKCLSGVLTENDFDFIKGVVRSKIIALPLMSNIFNERLIAQEDFSHGAVTCSIATADNKITIGFEDRIAARPKTLLRGNEIKQPVNIELILRRNRGTVKFDTIIQGDAKEFHSLFPKMLACGIVPKDEKQESD